MIHRDPRVRAARGGPRIAGGAAAGLAPSLFPFSLLFLLLFLLVLFFLATASPALAQPLEAQARLEPSVVPVDGEVFLTIEASGEGARWGGAAPHFELENLVLDGGPWTSQNLSMTFGGSRWQASWTWRLRPLRLGAAAVHSIRLEVGGQGVDLPPRRIEVVQEAPPGTRPPRLPPGSIDRNGRPPDADGHGVRNRRRDRTEEPEIFLVVDVDERAPWVGQKVRYTAWIYTQAPIRGIEERASPDFRDLWVRSIDISTREQMVRFQGEAFTRAPLLHRELYPLRPGTIVLDPLSLELDVERTVWGNLGLPRTVLDQVERATEPVRLEVRPLPEPPADLAAPVSGLVGPVELAASIEPAQVTAGQGATVTLEIRSDGHLEMLHAPELTAPEGIQILAPQEIASPEPDRRAWQWVVVPERPGTWELEPVAMAWFDPEAETYRVASTTVPPLDARRAPEPADDAGTGPPGAEAGDDPAALDADAEERASGLLGGPPWLVPGLVTLLVGLGTGLVLLLRRGGGSGGRSSAPQGPSGRSSGAEDRDRRPALATFSRQLARAREATRPRRAARTIEDAWRTFLAATWNLPAPTPPGDWPDRLEERGLPAADRSRLEALLADLDYLRWAPELSATGPLVEGLVAASERLGARLLDLRGPGG